MAVNPKNGKVYVSNTEAHNDVRFEGHTAGFTSVRGNAVENRITVLDPASMTLAVNDLNTHIDHAADRGDPALSLAFPQDLAFADFTLQISYPPNPIHNLDDSLTPEQEAGRAFFFNALASGGEAPSDVFHNCNGCHVLDRSGNVGLSAHPGFFGSDGRISFEGEPQIFKVPHLRNAYQKLGMYGSSPARTRTLATIIPPLNPLADSVRGFGYLHDGSVGTIEHFLTGIVFLRATQPFVAGGFTLRPNPAGIPVFADPSDPLNPASGLSSEGLRLRRAISSYVLAFDSNMKPSVGQQVTLTASNAASAGPRVELLEAQAKAGACDLVAQGRIRGRSVGFVLVDGSYLPNRSAQLRQSGASLRNGVVTDRDSLTFTCVPPGSGLRVGIDRDADGYADQDEIDAGSNPSDPQSKP